MNIKRLVIKIISSFKHLNWFIYLNLYFKTKMAEDLNSLALNLKKIFAIIILIPGSFFVAFGLIFNTISVFVFLRKKCWENTIGFYNVIMNINYNIIVILNALIYYPQALGNDMQLWSDFNCIFLPYSSRVFFTIFLKSQRVII